MKSKINYSTAKEGSLITISPPKEKSPKIVVVGQGAIGLLYYHHFSQQQYSVRLKASATNNQNIMRYSFTSHDKKIFNGLPITYANTDSIQTANILIFCLKSYQIPAAINELSPFISSDCLIILAHNGMGVFDKIVDKLPLNQRILAMLTTHGCFRSAALTIAHTGVGQTDLGLLNSQLSKGEIDKITSLFNTAIPSAYYHKSIKEKQWLKLAINCVINPITAIHNIKNGDIRKKSFTNIILKTLEEIVLIAMTQGIKLSLSELKKTVIDVADATALNSSSMRCDILAKRPSEIDYINGYIHSLGQINGIATPQNTFLWQEVNTLVNRYNEIN